VSETPNFEEIYFQKIFSSKAKEVRLVKAFRIFLEYLLNIKLRYSRLNILSECSKKR
jgi:hypothetical protein